MLEIWPNLLCSFLVCEVTQSCLTLCDPVDCSLPGSSFHGILQARILEWVAISFSRGSSLPRDRTSVSHIPGRCFNLWATREAHLIHYLHLKVAYFYLILSLPFIDSNSHYFIAYLILVFIFFSFINFSLPK